MVFFVIGFVHIVLDLRLDIFTSFECVYGLCNASAKRAIVRVGTIENPKIMSWDNRFLSWDNRVLFDRYQGGRPGVQLPDFGQIV